ncbi:hypothetical protein AVEN_123244-1 [Araneus ventricosus]|uniref:Uncharacterized protein n=1 Tax=Araneus ventricosus TaxID=182803 RepID=A0A4Y2KRZ3_ARAVE|nr:hypothetical protein AVEN_123244-1 [Araneus ventricosus]
MHNAGISCRRAPAGRLNFTSRQDAAFVKIDHLSSSAMWWFVAQEPVCMLGDVAEGSTTDGTFNFSETAFRSMDEKPEMFKSRFIDCVYYARTWNSFKFGKCCDKLEEQALVLMVDNGLSTSQHKRILEHAENLNCKLYPSYYKINHKQYSRPAKAHGKSKNRSSNKLLLQKN